MQEMRCTMIGLLISLLIITGCAPQVPQDTPSPSPTLDGTLRPYPSDTPTYTPLPTDYVSPTPTPTITNTPTPVFYIVKDSDDMFGIALRYGISLEALKTANPTVLPNFMGVGTVLLIPITPQPLASPSPTVVFTPTATPLYSKLHAPTCYDDATGSLTCFILVENDFEGALENVGGVLSLIDNQTNQVRQEQAIMPLNLLPSGAAIPMVAYFSAPLPEDFTLSFAVDVIFPVAENDTRYMTTVISNQTLYYGNNNSSAQINGQIALQESEQTAERVWILVIAFDEARQVVGIRRWESPSSLLASNPQTFQLTVYSLGPAIDQVELIAEAIATQN